jgi:subtilase family serine protease
VATTTTTVASHKGFGPADLQSAYALPSATGGTGQTVAIVDAYDDPQAEADLAVYRSYYGLAACTSSTACFRKVNQRGTTTSYPPVDRGWAQEISLDLDMVSAACPNCHILLVEADSSSLNDMQAAENTAAALGATVISNSFGVAESAFGSTPDDSAYRHTGVAVTASSGDTGYGVAFPASSDAVTAVGGTSLTKDSSARGWSETAWSGSGSGCSAFFAKPSWQHDTGCARRTVADVSAVADPRTGVAVYDSVDDGAGHHGWLVFGGTSVGAPLSAGAYALAGNGATAGPGYPYAHAGSLNDVTAGSNGTCSPPYLCTAGPGYDGPTGLGTPNGIGAF